MDISRDVDTYTAVDITSAHEVLSNELKKVYDALEVIDDELTDKIDELDETTTEIAAAVEDNDRDITTALQEIRKNSDRIAIMNYSNTKKFNIIKWSLIGVSIYSILQSVALFILLYTR